MLARILLQQPTLLRHVDIDSCGRGVGVTQQIFYDLDVRSHLHQQAAAGVAEGVRCYLWVVDADNAQAHLYYLGDCCVQEAC